MAASRHSPHRLMRGHQPAHSNRRQWLMLQDMKGKKVEIIFGPFDAVDGEVTDIDENWLKLKRKKKIILVQIDEIRRIICSE
ncbi:MAG: DUF6897 domain-containing protein [Pseudomonadota bacterium]